MRLQAHAVPLVDTIESVINKLLNDYEIKESAPIAAGVPQSNGIIRQFDPYAPPELTHTKILSVEFDGKALERREVNWNGLIYAAVRKAKRETKSAADFKQLLAVNVVEGPKSDKGYRFLSDIGLSVQGQDANTAWRAARHVAQQLGCPLKVNFLWPDKEDAAFPGIMGQFFMAGR
jgi:hypothetical protein